MPASSQNSQGRGVAVSVTGGTPRVRAAPAQPRAAAAEAFAPDVIAVDDDPVVEVAPAYAGRTQCVIRNDGGDEVALGFSDDIDFDSAPIHVAAGEHWIEAAHKGAIYAVTAAGTSTTVVVQDTGES